MELTEACLRQEQSGSFHQQVETEEIKLSTVKKEEDGPPNSNTEKKSTDRTMVADFTFIEQHSSSAQKAKQ